jgi:hypothetical protein
MPDVNPPQSFERRMQGLSHLRILTEKPDLLLQLLISGRVFGTTFLQVFTRSGWMTTW